MKVDKTDHQLKRMPLEQLIQEIDQAPHKLASPYFQLFWMQMMPTILLTAKGKVVDADFSSLGFGGITDEELVAHLYGNAVKTKANQAFVALAGEGGSVKTLLDAIEAPADGHSAEITQVIPYLLIRMVQRNLRGQVNEVQKRLPDILQKYDIARPWVQLFLHQKEYENILSTLSSAVRKAKTPKDKMAAYEAASKAMTTLLGKINDPSPEQSMVKNELSSMFLAQVHAACFTLRKMKTPQPSNRAKGNKINFPSEMNAVLKAMPRSSLQEIMWDAACVHYPQARKHLNLRDPEPPVKPGPKVIPQCELPPEIIFIRACQEATETKVRLTPAQYSSKQLPNPMLVMGYNIVILDYVQATGDIELYKTLLDSWVSAATKKSLDELREFDPVLAYLIANLRAQNNGEAVEEVYSDALAQFDFQDSLFEPSTYSPSALAVLHAPIHQAFPGIFPTQHAAANSVAVGANDMVSLAGDGPLVEL